MSLIHDLGFTKHEVSTLAHDFNLKHTPACRANTPKGCGRGYVCICDFWTRVQAAAFAVAFDGVEERWG